MASLFQQIREKFGRFLDFFTLTFFRLADGFLGMVKDVLLTNLFGLGAFMDAYFLVYSYISMGGNFFQQSGYGVLLPFYNDQNEETDPKAREQKQNRIIITYLNITTLAMAVISLLIAIFHRPLANLMGPELQSRPEGHLSEFVLITLALCILFQGCRALRLLLLQREQFLLFRVPELVGSVAFIVGLVVMYPKIDYLSVLWTLPLAYAIEFILALWLLKLPWRPIVDWEWFKPMFRITVPLVMFWGVQSMRMAVEMYLLMLLEAGELSAFKFAFKIAVLLAAMTVVNYQLTQIPKVMEAGSEQNFPLLRQHLRRSILESVLVSLPVVLLLYWFAEPAISLVYQRGAFSAEDTALVAFCLHVVMLRFPTFALSMLTVRVFNSLYLVKENFWFAVLNLMMCAVLCFIGAHWFGLIGMLCAHVAYFYIDLIVRLIYLSRVFRQREREQQAQ